MANEVTSTYRRFRDANDAAGNLAWAAKLNSKALKHGSAAPSTIESDFEMTDGERVIWRLLKIPRRYNAAETTGLLDTEQSRAFLRGLVAADVAEVVEGDAGKPILPMEISRTKRAIKGVTTKAPVRRKSIDERVFRPDISGKMPEAEAAPPERAAPKKAAPAPVAEVTKPQPAPAAAMSGEDKSLKKRIEERFKELEKLNHYEFLGLTPECAEKDIKSAYVKGAREWHPDKLAGTPLESDEKLKDKLDAVFKRLQEANQILSSSGSRATYDRQLMDGGHRPSSGQKVRRPQEAAVMVTKAEVFFRKKEYKEAEAHFRTASELDFEDPKILTKLAWVIYLNDKRDKVERAKEAHKRLSDIVTKFNFGDAAYKLGLIARNDGKDDAALKHFKKAARLDPKHREAKREVDLADRRKQKASADAADEKKSGIGRFFKG